VSAVGKTSVFWPRHPRDRSDELLVAPEKPAVEASPFFENQKWSFFSSLLVLLGHKKNILL
jgi:hypothetical protein